MQRTTNAVLRTKFFEAAAWFFYVFNFFCIFYSQIYVLVHFRTFLMSEIINSHVANKCLIGTYVSNPTQFIVFGRTYEFHQYGSGNENLFQNRQLNKSLLS